MVTKKAVLLCSLPVFGLIAALTVSRLMVPEVIFATAHRGTAMRSITGNVAIVPAFDARLVAPAQGVLLKFTLKEGDTVKKGDVMAEIDPGQWPFLLEDNRLELNRLNQRRQQGSITEIDLQKLRSAYEKNSELARAENYPKDVLERDRRDISKLEMATLQEKSDLDYACAKLSNKINEIQQEIERRTIRATHDGVVTSPSVVQGDTVFHGGIICNITSHAKVVKVEINQDDLAAVRRSQRVLVRLFTPDANTFNGTLSRIIPIGSQSTQRFTVFVDIPDLPISILSGQSGEATFVEAEHPDSILIPRQALLGTDCFILNNDHVVKRSIKVGYSTLSEVEVLEGLTEGDRVVALDPDLRRDGERVRARSAPVAK